ncbi:B3 domain-containing protein Os03g0212300 [Coffea arabica]|uniref:B3 domain-containing protein Os03g0212300 n=1 Tax=Coffea arabica TaxID=13443 RepID=A0A6P6UMF3_COFAR|nr:B3 domain-containing protein REM5-like [Coffea arabica]
MAKRKDKAVKEKRALLLKCNTNTYHVESSNSMRNHLSRSKKDTTVQEKDARKGGRIAITGLTLQDPSIECRGRDHTGVSGGKMRSGCATNNQQGESRVVSRFFKFIAPDFEAELRLPPRFCRKLSEKIPEQAFLGSRKGFWEVTIGKRSDGLLTLGGKGWKSFIHDHELKFGDFMVFEHTGGMVFKTYVFDPSACEKDYSSAGSENLTTNKVPCAQPRTLPNVAGIKDAEEEAEEAVGSYYPDNPHFRITINRRNLRCNILTIPSEFVNSKYLNQKTSVTLRNASGGEWQVKLTAYRTGYKAAYTQVVMAKGWGDFHMSNQLKIDDVCLFELDRSTTLGSPSNAVMNVRVLSNNIPSTS